MTGRKYRRLFAVCFVPLLLLGVLISSTLFRGDEYSHIVCNQPLPAFDNCRNLGNTDGNLYKSVKSEQPLWFEIQWEPYENNIFHTVFAEASARTITDVRITEANPFVGQAPEADRLMLALVEKPNTSLQMGVEPGQFSLIDERFAILTCHTLKIHRRKSSYSAVCFGDGWGGELAFEASGEGLEILDRLRSSVNQERSDQYSGVLLYHIVMWPIFIYLFGIASFIVWITSKAIKFVRAG